MSKTQQQTREKQLQVIEAVRRNLEGTEAIDFIRQSGYAMTPSGIARHLRSMGGRATVEAKIAEGQANHEVLQAAFPDEDIASQVAPAEPSQTDLFGDTAPTSIGQSPQAMFESVRMTIRVPEDVHEAIKIAAKVEGKRQNDLIVEILEQGLSRLPAPESPANQD